MTPPSLDNPSSPNAIPARSSSTGYIHAVHHQASKPVLVPLPEETWISNKSVPGMHQPQIASSPPLAGGGSSSDYSLTNGSPGIQTHRHKKEKIIMGPYDYLFSHPGKDIRSAMIEAFNVFLKVPPSSLKVITKVVGMLHTSSLLIDDVQDNSILRRGVPVAHNIFGTAQTINSANYVYFLAMQELQHLEHKEDAMHVFISELLNLHRGQGMDLYWRDTLTCPTEDDYLEMVQNKTGGLFRLAINLMQAESPERGRIDCVPLVNLMGLVFQICDDYLNLSSSIYTQNKGMCEDLTEGKFSFPVIHSIRANPGNLQLINILKQRTHDEEVKRYAVKYMESTGSFEYTRKVVRELRNKALAVINELDADTGRGAGVRKILDKMDIEKPSQEQVGQHEGKN
ncbi:geranylgeranyl pyrophosphate synthetase [Lithohypha guttulata]|nr:geranylgeranyl pyrophosphate synthetase [Lithohypha guttulata]